jgi:5-hydroxyisourate hydrolase
VATGRPTISTHVLDTAAGRPRAGVTVRLLRLGGAGPTLVGTGETDEDGRVRDLLSGAPLRAGTYRLEFALGGGGFFAAVALDLFVEDEARGYHVPLLLAPFGVTSYRGS